MFVDSHCHLSFPGLCDRIDAIRAEMVAARVDRALVIAVSMEDFPAVHALAQAHDNFWATVGMHPDHEEGEEPTVGRLVELAGAGRVVAIGETGLDYFRLNGRTVADMAWQRDRFRVHIRAARHTGLPLVIHTRSASADTLSILREEQGADVGGVFHCFTETAEVARAALDMGFHISFSGIISFRNAEDLRAVARMVPLDRCLIETDSPYLAPAPHRGRINQPAYVADVAMHLAKAKAVSLEEVAEATTRNFERLFARTKPTAKEPSP